MDRRKVTRGWILLHNEELNNFYVGFEVLTAVPMKGLSSGYNAM
jgi:hypothetical protein